MGNSKICLLQCTTQYPLKIKDANLKVIPEFIRRYKCNVGFSDHSTSNVQSLAAIGLGASVFEKHITLDKSSDGPDHFYAAEPNEFKKYVLQLHEAYESLGSPIKEMVDSEKKEGRRDGLYYNDSMSKGEIIDSRIEIKRPAIEIRSRYYDLLKGAKLRRDVNSGDAVKWCDLEF
jgi:sialic acid synthase SpsE